MQNDPRVGMQFCSRAHVLYAKISSFNKVTFQIKDMYMYIHTYMNIEGI